jgi:NADH:ubiquinone reductase (H+-translocating)
MAMIGRNAAIAEMGEHRHELHGPIAFASWLGVHAWLMTGVRTRIEAFIDWSWDYFSKSRGPQILDRTDVARIDWGDDDEDDQAEPGVPAVEQNAAGSVAAP